MTQFSDFLALGPVPRRRLPWDSINNNGSHNAFGVNGVGRGYMLDVVPLTKANLATTLNVASSSTLTLTSNGSSIVGTNHPANGSSIYLLDCERGISISSTADLSGVTFTLTGYDNYAQQLTATGTGPNNGTATFLKAVRAVQSMTASGTANPVTISTADVFGLNVALNDRGYLGSAYFNGTACQTVTTADQTSPATGATGDVRGTITPGTAGASNGTRRLIVTAFASDAQIGPDASTSGTSIYGVTQV